jgi:uncharacterized protein (DUF1330 family)
MTKAYWIAHVDVSDPEAYQGYVAANGAAFSKYGAKFIVRGGDNSVMEGRLKSRHVVIEFETYQQALDCYNSPEYAHAKSLRDNASDGDLVIVQGYDGPQPQA